jgi:molecular chaperone IbpA
MVKLTTANWDNFLHTFPQIERQFIGFNRVFDLLQKEFEPVTNNFPPFNIQKIDDEKFEIQLALAGFKEENLDVIVEDGTLTIKGDQLQGCINGKPDNFIHKGIAERKFTRSWSLADTVVVKGAKLEDGVLTVSLVNEIPEAKKPKSIEIKTK